MSKQLKILVGSVVVGLALYGQLNATTSTTSNATLIITEPDALDLYIERLAFAESSGREDVEIVDTNGKWSRGCLQFQDASFRYFAERYGIKGEQMDCLAQKALARKILLHERNGYRHWLTSVRKIGLPPLPTTS